MISRTFTGHRCSHSGSHPRLRQPPASSPIRSRIATASLAAWSSCSGTGIGTLKGICTRRTGWGR